MLSCSKPHSGQFVLKAISSSGAVAMTCLKAACSVCSKPTRSCSPVPSACTARAVNGAKALPCDSFAKKDAPARSSAMTSPTRNAWASSACSVCPAWSCNPSTSGPFSAPGTWPLRMFRVPKRAKSGHPDCAVAAHGTSKSNVMTGEETCSKPAKSCTNAAGSSTVAKDINCKHNFPRPHSSGACAFNASTAFKSLSAASKAADKTSRLGRIKGEPPAPSKMLRKCLFAAIHPAARDPAVHAKSSGASDTPPPVAACCCIMGGAAAAPIP
mmetsp:Transcript_105626/g.264477  ORF Transcript_105626/g.264477 Transcript_105626/m.264477 type:complete len:270 (-) Transcript_105626:375-1184(-)